MLHTAQLALTCFTQHSWHWLASHSTAGTNMLHIAQLALTCFTQHSWHWHASHSTAGTDLLHTAQLALTCFTQHHWHWLASHSILTKSLHLPIRPYQPVSHPIFIISSQYTSHHGLSVLQPQNFSRCHSYLQTLVGAPSVTALLWHGIQFLLQLKIVPFYTVSSATSSLTS